MNDFDISSIIDSEEDEAEEDLGIEVTTPSGNKIVVLNQGECDYYEQVAKRYQSDNKFSNVSDILELDRILLLELMCHRWGLWLLSGQDYQGRKINPTEIQKSIKDYSSEIRDIKRALGIDKRTRDADSGESVAAYVQNLTIRAKEFGVKRNNEAIKAITILKELEGLITLYENSSPAERKEFNCELEDIKEWIKRKIPEFNAIDESFRKNQKIWVRELNK